MLQQNHILSQLADQALNSPPLSLCQLPWPDKLQVAVIAPHPDDFDAIACTLAFFHQAQATITLFVLSDGSKGVEDSYHNNGDWDYKARLREQEQRASCKLFGLPSQAIHFLRLQEAEDGELADSSDNRAILYKALKQHSFDVFMLPYGEDSNSAHRRTYRMARNFADSRAKPTLALYNKDAKTTAFNTHLHFAFNQSSADWKARLLRCHDTQQARNLNLRGYGFDERVLRFNHQLAQDLQLEDSYAEAFQIEYFGGSNNAY